MLSPKQTAELKKQIISQINENFPADKKEFAKQQIESMAVEEFEEFLKQNHLIKDDEEKPAQQCVFCSIVKGETKSFQVDENEDAIAVLEINPISRAHTLIIPKEHVTSEQIPESVLTLAKKISQKVKKQFEPKEINLYSSTLFGHSTINVLPIYKDENQNSERKKAKTDELEEIQELLKEKPKPQKPVEIQKPKKIENTKLPRRIP